MTLMGGISLLPTRGVGGGQTKGLSDADRGRGLPLPATRRSDSTSNGLEEQELDLGGSGKEALTDWGQIRYSLLEERIPPTWVLANAFSKDVQGNGNPPGSSS